jgi:hypothetical protein
MRDNSDGAGQADSVNTTSINIYLIITAQNICVPPPQEGQTRPILLDQFIDLFTVLVSSRTSLGSRYQEYLLSVSLLPLLVAFLCC